MSEIAKENQTAAANAEPAKKKGGKKLIIALILIFILLGGAGGGFYYWRAASAVSAAEKEGKDAKKSRAKKEAEAVDEEEEAKPQKVAGKSGQAGSLKDALPDDEGVKQIIELQPFIINLADTEQARYLRLSVSLGVDVEEAEASKPNQLFITRVRNAMLAVLSNKKSEDVLSIEGKATLRKELLSAAQAASEDPEVRAIYITDFIVQL